MTALIPILTTVTLYLGATFNLLKYEKSAIDVFNLSSLKDKVLTIDRSFTRSQYRLIETSSEARDFLDVTGDLSLRVKSGSVEFSGAGSYLKDSESGENFVEMLVKVEHETVTETIPSDAHHLTGWQERPKDQVGTHYVRSLVYGGELVAWVRFKASNRTEKEKIKAVVAANLKFSGNLDLDAKGQFEKIQEELQESYRVEIDVSATVPPRSPPQTPRELIDLVQEYPILVKQINQGKGNPLRAELVPLVMLDSNYKFNYIVNSAVYGMLEEVERKFDDIRISKTAFLKWNYNRPTDATEEKEKMVNEYYEELENADVIFRSTIENLDTSSNGDLTQFNKAFSVYGAGPSNTPNKYIRNLWKLRHEVTEEEYVWEKPTGTGTTFTHWGKSVCSEQSNVVYTGFAAGAPSKSMASGGNYQCLPSVLGPSRILKGKLAYLRGVLREEADTDTVHGILCSTCLLKRSLGTKIFVGRTSCPENWNLEYSGFIMTPKFGFQPAQMMCMDEKPSPNNVLKYDDAIVLTHITADCQNCNSRKFVTCVVCSQ